MNRLEFFGLFEKHQRRFGWADAFVGHGVVRDKGIRKDDNNLGNGKGMRSFDKIGVTKWGNLMIEWRGIKVARMIWGIELGICGLSGI
jgi:hypothetical protein